MSINNINNLPNIDNSVNRVGSDIGAGEQSANALSNGNIDWFSSANDGLKTLIKGDLPLPPLVQAKLDTAGTPPDLDAVANVMVEQLGFS